MEAYRIDRFGSVDGIVLRSSEDPRPRPKEVLMRVRASSLNYRDLMVLKGGGRGPTKIGVIRCPTVRVRLPPSARVSLGLRLETGSPAAFIRDGLAGRSSLILPVVAACSHFAVHPREARPETAGAALASAEGICATGREAWRRAAAGIAPKPLRSYRRRNCGRRRCAEISRRLGHGAPAFALAAMATCSRIRTPRRLGPSTPLGGLMMRASPNPAPIPGLCPVPALLIG